MDLIKTNWNAEFTSEMLGTIPKDRSIFETIVLKKADKAEKNGIEVDKDAEMTATPEDVAELSTKGRTGFHRDEKSIFIYDYMIKGNIKSNIESLMQSGQIPKISSYKSHLDKWLFITPREIRFYTSEENLIEISQGNVERIIRIWTKIEGRMAQVTVPATSEIVKIGTKFSFEVTLLKNKDFDMDLIRKALDYSKLYGLGQWRGSGGYGRYIATETI